MKSLYINFLETTRNIVEANYEKDTFGCPELCELLQMSRSHVHRMLKIEMNMSCSGFIKQIRLEKAKELLTTTNNSVSDVAYKVGYSDANYFSRSFSESYGMPPSQYKQKIIS